MGKQVSSAKGKLFFSCVKTKNPCNFTRWINSVDAHTHTQEEKKKETETSNRIQFDVRSVLPTGLVVELEESNELSFLLQNDEEKKSNQNSLSELVREWYEKVDVTAVKSSRSDPTEEEEDEDDQDWEELLLPLEAIYKTGMSTVIWGGDRLDMTGIKVISMRLIYVREADDMYYEDDELNVNNVFKHEDMYKKVLDNCVSAIICTGMCVCMCMCVCVCMYVCMYVYVCVYVCMLKR